MRLAPSTVLTGKAIEKRCQRNQIRNPKRRPPSRYPDERILRRNAGPACRKEAHLPVPAEIRNTFIPPALLDLDDVELGAVKRMKRVSHPKAPPPSVGIGCNRLFCPTAISRVSMRGCVTNS